MRDRGLDLDGAPHSREILTAPVPGDLRTIFSRLAAGGTIDALLPPNVNEVPLAARQLIKLASFGGALRLASIALAPREEGLAIEVRREDHALHFSAADLAEDIRMICSRILDALYEPAALARTLEAVAAESATLSTLGTLTSHMLRAPNLDHALYAMLSGVTSGFGLAFHRAALFVLDPTVGTFVGSKAIGPVDEEEAHRIWEEMEYEDKELSQIVGDYAEGKVDNRFETFVRALVLKQGESPDDELTAALASTAPILFEREQASNPSLRTLHPGRAFVLAPIAPHAGTHIAGLLFADDAWSREPIAAPRLSRLRAFLDQLTLVWENLALLVQVEKLARVDALTGAHNRRVFEERLRDEQSRTRRTGSTMSVLVIDVDRFKDINDARGHAAGDEALRKIAMLLDQALREHDTVARIGGDEFAIILPGVARDEALVVAKRIGVLAKSGGVSVSIGGASVPDDTIDPGAVLQLADANLYTAKRAGRGRVQMGAGTEAEF